MLPAMMLAVDCVVGLPTKRRPGASCPSRRFAQELNKLWKNRDFEKRATFLADAIQTGIDKWGVATVNGTQVYVYETDGLGGVLVRR